MMPRPISVLLTVPLLAAGLLAALPGSARADDSKRIGAVSTTFRVLGKNDKVVVDRYDDPRVSGVSCYVSRAETGGVKGSLGLATDPSRYSIACRATGPVEIHGTLPENETVFDEKANIFFKSIRVNRMFDKEKRVILYLVWSTLALAADGSPYNSITAVPLDR